MTFHPALDANFSFFSGMGNPAIDDTETLIRLGKKWLGEGRVTEARHCFELALPRLPAEALTGLGDAFFHERRLRLALICYEKALRRGAEPRQSLGQRWTARMMLGQFERAWRENDRLLPERLARARSGEPIEDPNIVWDGQPLAGRRVMVRCLHGLGDSIMFVRCLPLMREQAAEVILEAPPALLCLLREMHGIDRLTTWGANDEPAYDAQIEITELPYILRLTPEAVPARIPYLSVPATCVESVRPLMERGVGQNGGLKVGLIWAAGVWDERRSAALALFEPLLATAGVTFFSLQRGPQAALLGQRRDLPLVDVESRLHDPLATAAAMMHLDLVISVDTMTAHLAGALGRPVWVLLPHEADWRWMLDRDDSPWYPTMRLFRQNAPGDWRAPLAQMTEALAELARQGGFS